MNKGRFQKYTFILYDQRGKERCRYRLGRVPNFINEAMRGSKPNRAEIIKTFNSRFILEGEIKWEFITIINEQNKIVKRAHIPRPPVNKNKKPKVKAIREEDECDCGCSRCQDDMYCKKCSYHGQKKFERNWA